MLRVLGKTWTAFDRREGEPGNASVQSGAPQSPTVVERGDSGDAAGNCPGYGVLSEVGVYWVDGVARTECNQKAYAVVVRAFELGILDKAVGVTPLDRRGPLQSSQSLPVSPL